MEAFENIVFLILFPYRIINENLENLGQKELQTIGVAQISLNLTNKLGNINF